MSALVERVAKAIFASDMRWLPILEHQFEENRMVYLNAARAAIEAMREPTNAMLKASCGAMSEGKRPTPDRVSSKEKHRIRYRAMIDAELGRQTFAEAVALPNGER